jgi:DNA-binding LacI/PurR family transcriptional regulator
MVHFRPVPLIVSNNVMTEDILYYLDKNKMFGKIALVGYNDSDYLNYALRRIYSISQPASALGQTAGRHILAQIEHQAPPQHEELCATFSEPKLWL